MTPPAHIRTFAWDDLDAVLALWVAAGFRIGPSEARDGVALKLRRDPELFLVAEADGRAIVGALLGAFDGRRGWVYHLAVDELWRGRGIGSALLAELERRLVALGCRKVNLLVDSANDAVEAFYRGLGYATAEVRFMEKWLPTEGP